MELCTLRVSPMELEMDVLTPFTGQDSVLWAVAKGLAIRAVCILPSGRPIRDAPQAMKTNWVADRILRVTHLNVCGKNWF